MAGGKKTVGGSDLRVELAPFNPVGTHNQETELDAVVALVPPNAAYPPTKVMVQVAVQNVRFTIDGSAPTPVYGFILTAGRDPVIITLGPDTNIQFFEVAAGAVLEYVWGQ